MLRIQCTLLLKGESRARKKLLAVDVRRWCSQIRPRSWMMHVPIGPDGERKWSLVTAGLLCVHGAEQGEALYGTAQLSLSLTLPFIVFSVPPSLRLLHLLIPNFTQNQEFSVELYSYTLTLKMLRSNAFSASLLLSFILFTFSSIILWLPISSSGSPLVFPSHCATLFSSETITVFSVSLPCTAAVWDSDSRAEREGEPWEWAEDVCVQYAGQKQKGYIMVCCRRHCSVTSVCASAAVEQQRLHEHTWSASSRHFTSVSVASRMQWCKQACTLLNHCFWGKVLREAATSVIWLVIHTHNTYMKG